MKRTARGTMSASRRLIEARFVRERINDQAREIDRAQQARAIGRQWLFAAIVDQNAIGIEAIDAGNLNIIDRLDADRLDRFDCGDERTRDWVGA